MGFPQPVAQSPNTGSCFLKGVTVSSLPGKRDTGAHRRQHARSWLRKNALQRIMLIFVEPQLDMPIYDPPFYVPLEAQRERQREKE